MYNLFRFFVTYHVFLLFLGLEGFCIYLIYKNNHYNQVAYIHTANNVSGRLYSAYTGITDYLYLRSTNDSLVEENARLREQLIDSKYDNRIDTGAVSDSSKKYVQNYTYIAAEVIRNSLNRPVNYIYLNKGSKHGIKKQMGVICSNGIVGQVVSVTENYSAVMSVLSKDFKVSARFLKNDYFGNISWDGNSTTHVDLEQIAKHVPVKVGDTLVTSGYSQLFPKNVMVGTVSKVEAEPEKNMLDVRVKLSTSFGNVSYVYVVNNIRKSELIVLDTVINLQSPKQ
ncbi:MAG: rod shape-determining protein MreC [Chitinophagales bacterium]|nr:rod shape-determining protein MreC [Chitinophagales bacterium]